MTSSPNQHGVALITAIMIVAITSVMAASLVGRLQLNISRTENIIQNEQAYLYTLGGETIAQAVLLEDRKDNQHDSLDQDWATQLPPNPVEGGLVSGALSDLQGRYNLNNLSPQLNANGHQQEMTRFRRLLTQLNLDAGLADALLDWLDSNHESSSSHGAENDYYMGLERPYRAANTIMSSPSELRLVRGFDQDEAYLTLLPFICTLPEITAINVNTAPAEVLRSVLVGINDSDIADLISQRDGEQDKNNGDPFKTMAEFTSAVQQLSTSPVPTNGLTVATEYFLLSGYAQIGRGQLNLYSIIQRDELGASQIIQRSQGAW